MSDAEQPSKLRLLEARRLLTADGASVTTAAYDVGYESLSRFSREYARKFGVLPSRDATIATGWNRPAFAMRLRTRVALFSQDS